MDAPARPNEPKLLRRYTDLPAAIDLLMYRRLVLLDPMLWDDRNDSHFIRRYREIINAKSVLALCLSRVGETYHHWRVFCGHGSGVCIEFYRDRLIEAASAAPGVRSGSVKYRTLKDIEDKELRISDLPFIKRWAFRHEEEFRLIYTATDEAVSSHAINVPLSVVHGIALSPWLPPPLLEATRALLRALPGCAKLQITRSELINNERWKANAARLQPISGSVVEVEPHPEGGAEPAP